MISYKVMAQAKDGKIYCSWHKTKEEAITSKQNCIGKFPFGNKVKIIQIESPKLQKEKEAQID